MHGFAVPLQSGLDAVVGRYESYGPLLASFLANLLATFGDKGQLVVITLASRYDAKNVFVGSMAAFALWSGLEVLFGSWITAVLPGGVITLLTGGLFLAFGVWTYYSAVESFRVESGRDATALTGGGLDVGLSGRILPSAVIGRIGAYNGVIASFVFIAVAEFGDKTQLLTINLAATFPDRPVFVFIGVIAALGLRTGVDALIGERVERLLPTRYLELGAGIVFLGFGAAVLGLVPEGFLLGLLATLVFLGLAGLLAQI
ncbi:TMEM165/GDT1 family protein [Halopiger thermotolerans]